MAIAKPVRVEIIAPCFIERTSHEAGKRLTLPASVARTLIVNHKARALDDSEEDEPATKKKAS